MRIKGEVTCGSAGLAGSSSRSRSSTSAQCGATAAAARVPAMLPPTTRTRARGSSLVFTSDGVRGDLGQVHCPVAYMHGAKSDMGGPESRRQLEQWLGRPVAATVVPEAFHHVPLDQPAACAMAVRSLLGELEGDIGTEMN